jgi:hypothetical protein
MRVVGWAQKSNVESKPSQEKEKKSFVTVVSIMTDSEY